MGGGGGCWRKLEVGLFHVGVGGAASKRRQEMIAVITARFKHAFPLI